MHNEDLATIEVTDAVYPLLSCKARKSTPVVTRVDNGQTTR